VWRRTSMPMIDREKLSLNDGENPNLAWMNLVRDDGVVEQDGVVALGDFMIVAMAITTMGGAKRQRQWTARLEVAVD